MATTSVNLTIYDSFITPRTLLTSNITITVNDSTLFIDGRASFTNATNIGGDPGGIFANNTGNILNFKNLAPGSFITMLSNGSFVSIGTNVTTLVVGATNIGGDINGMYITNISGALVFKNLINGSFITLVNSNTTISINSNQFIYSAQVGTFVVLQNITTPLLTTTGAFSTIFSVLPIVNYDLTFSNVDQRYVTSWMSSVNLSTVVVNVKMESTELSTIEASANDVGRGTSMTLLNNNCPGISYMDLTSTILKFARNLAHNGNGAWVMNNIDTGITVPYVSSMKTLFDNTPAVAYWQAAPINGLKFARNPLMDGSGVWQLSIVDTSAAVGQYASLSMLSNSLPGISYYDQTNQDLKFATNPTTIGVGTWTWIVVNSTSNVGLFTSLATLSDGTPGIAYKNETAQDLMYARNSLASGFGTWTSVTVDSTGNVGEYNSLVVLTDGTPAIAYRDVTNQDLKYARNSQANGFGTWTTVTVDATGNVGLFVSLAVLSNGIPGISYRETQNGNNLKFAWNTELTGLGVWTSLIVDTGDVGQFTSTIPLLDGSIGVAYYSPSSDNLLYARSPFQSKFLGNAATYAVSWMGR